MGGSHYSLFTLVSFLELPSLKIIKSHHNTMEERGGGEGRGANVALFELLVCPHEVEPWSHSWYIGRVDAYLGSSL